MAAGSAEGAVQSRFSSFWQGAATVAAREAAASAGAGITVDSVFYSLDSYKTHAQTAKGAGKFGLTEFRGLFRGFVPVVLSGSAPSFAVFFSLYEPLKLSLQSSAAQSSVAHTVATRTHR